MALEILTTFDVELSDPFLSGALKANSINIFEFQPQSAKMLSMHDMFYANVEPVWVVKPQAADKKPKEKEQQQEHATIPEKKEQREEYSIFPYPGYPYYYPDTPAPPPAAEKREAPKETKVTLKVDICCEECVEILTNSIMEIKGVKTVDCNVYKEKVVVTCAPDAAPADVLLRARKEFRHARFWSDDD
ncbi:hypothetical protein R1sor_022310 [Riccia sorocarpa]|uniref:HMA domain-containing protein n=1 Tax=Riccia sorocarpa TaxID=122646 RepID=A0ABD3GQC5_9MARC